MHFLIKIHSNIHRICIKKNNALIKAFFLQNNLSNMHYIYNAFFEKIIQQKSFISAFFEKKKIMHSFKHISYMHFPKTKKSKIS